MKAMILAAGMGIRLRPVTDNIPKALVEVNGKPLLQHALEHLSAYGIREVIVNVHHLGHQIIDFLVQHNNFGMEIAISDESDRLLETGGGIMKAAWFFDDGDPFLVRNVDVLSDLDLSMVEKVHNSDESLATLVVRTRKTARYFLFDNTLQLCGWENTRTGEQRITRQKSDMIPLAFSGIQVLDPKIFTFITESGRFSLTDLYLRLAETKKITGFKDDFSSWRDIGKPSELNG